MPRNNSGIHSLPPGTTAVPGEAISSTAFNTFTADMVSLANEARPISAGGTGATSASAARAALGAAASDILPPGVIVPYAGSTAPSGWLLCYGQSVSRTTYASLFDVIGTTYGAGDGSTTFTLPDLRGRVPVGKDDMGGAAASRVTSGGSGVDGATLGASGGAETHTITEAQTPAHTHDAGTLATASGGAHTHNINHALAGDGFGGIALVTNATGGLTKTTESGGAHTHTISGSTASAGSGEAHNNVQPTLILTSIIKT